jgi:hypothetical protein
LSLVIVSIPLQPLSHNSRYSPERFAGFIFF